MGIILVGVLLILAGAVGIFMGYSGTNWTTAGLGWGALIVGALATLFGFGKRASESVQTPHREVTDHANAEVKALIQSMGVIAMADKIIREQEVNTIATIHEQMLGIRISTEEVKEILSEFDENFDITKRLVANRSKISPTMKRTIVQSCQLVMVSDLEVVKPEQGKLREIGLALGFDQTEIEDMIASTAV